MEGREMQNVVTAELSLDDLEVISGGTDPAEEMRMMIKKQQQYQMAEAALAAAIAAGLLVNRKS